MNRSPLFYPLNRGLDAEAGGAADLQTDVMRFMAILALCLVAIFALVQSIPLSAVPAKPVSPAVVDAQDPEPAVIPPVPPAERNLAITRPAPQPVNQVEPRAEEVTAAPVQEPAPIEQIPTEEPSMSEPTGFTLRFTDDLALTRLVARNEVGLYAIAPEKSWRMNVNRGTFSFWPASVPNEFHEMDERTVPDDVRAALQRVNAAQSDDVKWGVTLPSNMQDQLNTYLGEARGGSLIIGADGKLRLEP